MKLLDSKKVGLLTTLFTTVATSAFAAPTTALKNGLADWASLVAEILSFVCLAVFIIYTGKYVNTTKSGNADSAENVRVTAGVRDGIMTALIGIGICQAVVIIAQTFIS